MQDSRLNWATFHDYNKQNMEDRPWMPGETERYEARKLKLKKAFISVLDMEAVLEWFKGDPMYLEVQEDMKREKERSKRDVKTKEHKKFMQGMLRYADKIRSTMKEISEMRNSKRLYRKAWEEVIASKCRVEEGGGGEPEESLGDVWTTEELDMRVDEYHMDLKIDFEEELSRKRQEKARYKGKNGDKPEWETTTDEEEDFWVNQKWDWGDETVLMRRKRYRRKKAMLEGRKVPKREDDYESEWW